MDDIYEDLENYNDADEIERLKNENQELKTKFQEQAFAIKKLQQDYDILNEEFKKLERNYSSLLKTARNEIERKTQIITNLNIEKDMMVINYVHKNKNRNILNQKPYCKGISVQTKVKKDISNKVTEKGSQEKSVEKDNAKKSIEKDKASITKVKLLDVKKPIEEMKPNVEKEKSLISKEHNSNELLNTHNKILKVAEEKRDSIIENKSKYYVQKETEVKVDKKPISIKNRRKSMPILSENIAMFESDDEIDTYNTRERKLSHSNRDNSDRKLIETNGNVQDKKTSKTPSLEEKSSKYHELSKSSHRYRVSKRENDRLPKDKYDSSRSRRHSPERHNWRDNAYPKLDKRRTRVLISPPTEKYEKYHSRKHRDTRHYDRPQPYDFDRHRYYDERPPKHKLPNDFEESVKKRLRYETQKRYPIEEKIRYEVEMENDSLTETLEQLESQYASCQSPDYEQMDSLTSHPLKEIRETASSPLADPRVTSTRYILRLDDKGKKMLSTVAGRNVDIIPINRERWCLPKVDVPPLLVNKPLQCDDEIIKDIYANIDESRVNKNMSLEPNVLTLPSTVTQQDSNTNEDLKSRQITNKVGEQEKYKKQLESSPIQKESIQKYKIPKIKDCDSKILHAGDKNNGHVIPQLLTEKVKDIESKDQQIDKLEKKNQVISMSTQNKFIEETNFHSSRNHKTISQKIENHNSLKGIVEGDLELSDETSDNTEWRHLYKNNNDQCAEKKSKEREIVTKNDKKGINKGTSKDLKEKDNNKMETKSTQQSKIIHKDLNKDVQSFGNNEKNNDLKIKNNKEAKTKGVKNSHRSDSNKLKASKHDSPVLEGKSKRRKNSSKIKDAEQVEVCSKPIEEDKKNRSKRVKEPSIKNSNKFKEIFGTDSSSLITPEDLGIIENVSAKYVPFFEDAQDATDIEEIAKVKQDLMNIEKNLKPKSDDVVCENNVICGSKTTELTIKETNTIPRNTKKPGNSHSTITLADTKTVSHSATTETVPDIDNKLKHIGNLTLVSGTSTSVLKSALESNHATPAIKSVPEQLNIENLVASSIAEPEDVTFSTHAHVNTSEHKYTYAQVNKLTHVNTSENIDTNEQIDTQTHLQTTLFEATPGKITTTSLTVDTSAHIARFTPFTNLKLTPNSVESQSPITNLVLDTEKYANINPGTEKDPAVVKTIIISTGQQPQCLEPPGYTQPYPLVVNVERLEDTETPTELKFRNLDALKALATSTPHKDLKTAEDQIQNESSDSVNKASVVTEQSVNSVSVSQNDSDVPDVRIFVRRRRRNKMKPVS